jgi:hypothetical protein
MQRLGLLAGANFQFCCAFLPDFHALPLSERGLIGVSKCLDTLEAWDLTVD